MEPLSHDEAVGLLRDAPVAHVGMIDGDQPYVTPMSFVLEGENVYFRTVAGRKLDAIRANPGICIEVSTYDEETGDWASVIVMGAAEEVQDEETKTSVVSKLFEKYDKVIGSPLDRSGIRPLEGHPHVVVVEIRQVSGMSSGRGWAPRTKPGRL